MRPTPNQLTKTPLVGSNGLDWRSALEKGVEGYRNSNDKESEEHRLIFRPPEMGTPPFVNLLAGTNRLSRLCDLHH
jgi:hypothetical protein